LSTSFIVFVPVQPTLESSRPDGPSRWKSCSVERSRTVTRYVPRLSVRTVDEPFFSVIV
jgi:hypothetical protein